MSKIETAQEGIEHAHHAEVHGGDQSARMIAVLIAILAAALAISEMAAKSAQNEYMTKHIEVSNDWAFYQAKNVRATMHAAVAIMLAASPNAAEQIPQEAIRRAKAEEARLRDEPGGDGMKQLTERAHHAEHERDHAFHLYHVYEYVTGALQIAIVLASVAIVTRIKALAAVAMVFGVIASGVALFNAFS